MVEIPLPAGCNVTVTTLGHQSISASASALRLASAFLGILALLLSADRANAQVTAKTFIGRAVSDDSYDQVITDAINHFRNRDIDGCRAILERVSSKNPELPPASVMMAMLWLSVNQLGPARAELEDCVTRFPEDPEAYLMSGDLSYQEQRITDADLLFKEAMRLTAKYTTNPLRKLDFEIRCNAGNAAVAEARKQWAVATVFLAKWIEIDPDNAFAHKKLAAALFRLDKPKEAFAQLERAKILDPEADDPELAIARLHEKVQLEQAAARQAEESAMAAAERVQADSAWSGAGLVTRKLKAKDTPEAQAILKALNEANRAWENAQSEASQYSLLIPPAVWDRCLENLLAVTVADCPEDFRAEWEAYLVGCKEQCDEYKSRGSTVELAAAATKMAFSAGRTFADEVDKSSSSSKTYSDAAFRVRILAKRYGVE